MIQRFAPIFIGMMLLIVSSAEAMTGHCSQSVSEPANVEMSAHCAEMMQIDVSDRSKDRDPAETSTCCCVAMTPPILFEVTAGEVRSFSRSSWKLALNAAAHSSPSKVAIPPPRI